MYHQLMVLQPVLWVTGWDSNWGTGDQKSPNHWDSNHQGKPLVERFFFVVLDVGIGLGIVFLGGFFV